MTTPNDVKDIVVAAGGSLPGKTRFQKSAYLLEATGVGYGFDFSYHYYGPYSENLAFAADDAEALGLISLDWESSASGFRYATYRSPDRVFETDIADNEKRTEILGLLEPYDAVSLELAATAHFLAANGFAGKAWSETKKRKAGKANETRVLKAKKLLDELGLDVS